VSEQMRKACPCCAGDMMVWERHALNTTWQPIIGYRARCQQCRLSTDDYPTEAAAIAAWNQRAGETTGFDAWYQAILSHAEESCAGCPLDGRCKNLKAVGMPCEIAPQMHKIETALRQLYDERGRG
jgi:hypothetical protein